MATNLDHEAPLIIGEREIRPGQTVSLDLPVARLHTHAELTMPVTVLRGRRPGPRLFVSAAVHGDEINGVEIIRRLLRMRRLKRLRGTLIAVPVVNIFGFIAHSRYLPDRRDLNRAFPGSERGSLAARLADQFMTEIVANATHGIDLHTGAIHRSNLPQIRAHLDDAETERLAKAFGAPVVLDTGLLDGSLRAAVSGRNVPILLYEGGEALRFDEWAIRAGLRGVTAVMHALGMLPASTRSRRPLEPLLARGSSWVRAHEGGILRAHHSLGRKVARGDVLGVIGDPVGARNTQVIASAAGIVIGRTNLPLVNEGDALFHVAQIEKTGSVTETIEAFQAELEHRFVLPPEEPLGGKDA